MKAFAVALLLLLTHIAATAAAGVPSFEAVRAAHRLSDVPVLARDGRVLQTVRTQMQGRQGPWLALDEISPALRTAIVLGEDRRFWQHGGVDWQALAGAAWANAWNERTRGASTLSMQLAALSNAELLRPAGGRSVVQKLTQLRRAQQFEAAWSKAQILEAYLNRVPLRGELVGISAASLHLFRKHASGLDAVEAALLAALVRAPNAGAAAVERRACEVLKLQQMGCESVPIALAQALARRPTALLAPGEEALAPHLAARLAGIARPGRNPACNPAQNSTRSSAQNSTPIPANPSPPRWTQRCSAPPSQRCGGNCRNCVAAMLKTAPCWCWTTPVAKCWPGWAARARPCQRRPK